VSAGHHVFTYAEYLARELESGLKHEFLRGQVFAVAGGTPEHARLIATITGLLLGMVDPERCRVFSSDLKIRVPETGLATYPDVAVVCGALEVDAEDPNAVTNPRLLVEVLSPRTEAYDRGEKWAHYARLRSLDAYVLVNPVPSRLEVFERNTSGEFVHRMAEPGADLPIACFGGALSVDAVFEHAVV
jgi:Uma2 family endonuclease